MKMALFRSHKHGYKSLHLFVSVLIQVLTYYLVRKDAKTVIKRPRRMRSIFIYFNFGLCSTHPQLNICNFMVSMFGKNSPVSYLSLSWYSLWSQCLSAASWVGTSLISIRFTWMWTSLERPARISDQKKKNKVKCLDNTVQKEWPNIYSFFLVSLRVREHIHSDLPVQIKWQWWASYGHITQEQKGWYLIR